MTGPLLPDVVRLVSAYLRRVPEVRALVRSRVYTVFPKQVGSDPLVLVQRIGGTPLSTGRAAVVDVAAIQLDAYGGTQAAAGELSSTLVAALADLEGEQPDDTGNVCAVRIGPKRWLPDETWKPPRARYVTDVEVTIKPAGVVLAGTTPAQAANHQEVP